MAVAPQEPPAVPEEPPAVAEEAAPADQAAAAEAAGETVVEQDLLELVPPSANSELDGASGVDEAAEGAGAES